MAWTGTFGERVERLIEKLLMNQRGQENDREHDDKKIRS